MLIEIIETKPDGTETTRTVDEPTFWETLDRAQRELYRIQAEYGRHCGLAEEEAAKLFIDRQEFENGDFINTQTLDGAATFTVCDELPWF